MYYFGTITKLKNQKLNHYKLETNLGYTWDGKLGREENQKNQNGQVGNGAILPG